MNEWAVLLGRCALSTPKPPQEGGQLYGGDAYVTAVLEVERHHHRQDRLGYAVVTNNSKTLVTYYNRSLFLAQAT